MVEDPGGHAFEVRANAFYLDGSPVLLRGGTVQWFRMPEELWDDRLRRFKAAGFNTVEMYVAWNVHELEEGVFDFESPNLTRFLELCKQHGLFVYFRPGPYITNELDGGGLPAYLFTRTTKKSRSADGKPNLRTNDPDYLAEVERYFDALNDVVRPYLVTHGGPIILYSIENEYDWFELFHEVDKVFWFDGEPERDPLALPGTRGYFEALRDMARADGIDVPLTTCPGDAKVRGTGDVEGVIPMPNIYKPSGTEQLAYDIVTSMHDQHRFGGAYNEFATASTETDRTATRFKRLFMGGMDGAFAFNVVGFSQTGLLNSVTMQIGGPRTMFKPTMDNALNAFVSPTFGYFHSVIDYFGAVGPSGTLRAKFHAFRRANLFFDAFEARIGAVLHPQRDDPRVQLDHDALSADYWLEADDGGYFIGIVNESGAAQMVPNGALVIDGVALPRHGAITVPVADYRGAPGDGGVEMEYSLIVVTGSPLVDGIRLRYSTSEILTLRAVDGVQTLFLYGVREGRGELLLEGDYEWVERDERLALEADGALSYSYGSEARTALARAANGELLRLVVTDRHLAGRVWFGEDFAIGGPDQVTAFDGERVSYEHSDDRIDGFVLDQRGLRRLQQDTDAPFPALPDVLSVGTLRANAPDGDWYSWSGDPMPLEELGIYRGHAWYRVEFDIDGPPSAPWWGANLWADHASDFVGIYVNGTYVTTLAPLGTEIDNRSWAPSYGFPDITPLLREGHNEITFRTEIWGHGSFMWPRGTMIGTKAAMPSMGFDAVKGLWGKVSLNGARLTAWSVHQGIGVPTGPARAAAIPLALERGDVVWYETSFAAGDLPDPILFHAPVVLSMAGANAKATIYLNGRVIGRWLSDEGWISRGNWARALRDMWMNTPPDDFPIPAELVEDHNQLLILFEDTSNHDGPTGRIDDLAIRYNRELRGNVDGQTVNAVGRWRRGTLELTP
ncbi:MAG: beta-galactosidase [Deltaproteobacteria bacterium]|nr:beta-galactosidase [Deltaproteobacteria bacterium]